MFPLLLYVIMVLSKKFDEPDLITKESHPDERVFQMVYLPVLYFTTFNPVSFCSYQVSLS